MSDQSDMVDCRLVLDSLGNRVCVVDSDGQIQLVNEAWAAFARSAGDPDGRATGAGVSYLEVCRRGASQGDRGAEKAYKGLGRLLAGQSQSFSLEYPCAAPNGEAMWFLMTATPMRHESGGAVVSHLDITDRKRAELALEDARQRLELANRIGRIGVWSWRPQDSALELDAGAAKLLGVEPDDIESLEELFDLFEPEQAEKLRVLFKDASRAPSADSAILELPGDPPKHIEVRLQSADRDSSVKHLGVFVDVSEREAAQRRERELDRRIQQAQKLESLGVLAGGIAHDFNNLLMGVLGQADLALLDTPRSSAARPRLEQIVVAARRASELTNQMLAYSGKGKFVVELIDIADLVDEIGNLLETVIAKRAVLKYRLDRNLPAVAADASQLRQVVMNLITNASDAIGDRSGVITISTGLIEADREYLQHTYLEEDLKPGYYVYLEVSDTGVGMDEETRNRMFEPFFTTKLAGRGLGMAAVLGIVRGHAGALKVYSQVGQGSTIKVLLPAAGVTPDDPTDAARPDAKGEGAILVADDEDSVRSVAKMMLERFGFAALTAKDGTEAIELYNRYSQQIRLVLLDLTMPGPNAQQILRELRRIDPGVRVLLSSGYSEEEVTAQFAGKALAGFLQKPYGSKELREAVFSALDPDPA